MDRRSRGVRSDRGLCRHRHEEIEKALKGGDTPSMPIEDPVETGKLLERGGLVEREEDRSGKDSSLLGVLVLLLMCCCRVVVADCGCCCCCCMLLFFGGVRFKTIFCTSRRNFHMVPACAASGRGRSLPGRFHRRPVRPVLSGSRPRSVRSVANTRTYRDSIQWAPNMGRGSEDGPQIQGVHISFINRYIIYIYIYIHT